MTHTEKLTQKVNELKNQGASYSVASDALYEYHKSLFLEGDIEARKEFNKENGLTEFARPEKSLWRMYEILEEVIEPDYGN